MGTLKRNRCQTFSSDPIPIIFGFLESRIVAWAGEKRPKYSVMVHLTSHSETQNSDGRIKDHDAGFLVFNAYRLVQSGIGHSKSVQDVLLTLFSVKTSLKPLNWFWWRVFFSDQVKRILMDFIEESCFNVFEADFKGKIMSKNIWDRFRMLCTTLN